MESMSFGTALLVTLIGMTVVFIGLCVLIGIIKLLAFVTGQMGKPKAKKAENPAPVAAPVSEPVADEAETDDEALIAVIAAAVACMMEDNTGFVVRRVRRVNTAPAWQKAGREEQIYSHF